MGELDPICGWGAPLVA